MSGAVRASSLPAPVFPFPLFPFPIGLLGFISPGATMPTGPLAGRFTSLSGGREFESPSRSISISGTPEPEEEVPASLPAETEASANEA